MPVHHHSHCQQQLRRFLSSIIISHLKNHLLKMYEETQNDPLRNLSSWFNEIVLLELI